VYFGTEIERKEKEIYEKGTIMIKKLPPSFWGAWCFILSNLTLFSLF
jgi:hypothetical protein